MKSLIFVLFFSLSAFASLNEVECEGKFENKTFKAQVEKDFRGERVFIPAHLIVKNEGKYEVFDYSVSSFQPGGFNRYLYTAYGFRLEVNLTPHPYPRIGWTYKGTLESEILGGHSIQGLKCRFPNAN